MRVRGRNREWEVESERGMKKGIERETKREKKYKEGERERGIDR